MVTDAPTVSVVIPTLNAARDLEACLDSLASQDYAGNVELVVADGGSVDETLEIVRKYGARVVPNPLKSAEAGKAAGVRASAGDLVLLLDSDNLLWGADWLTRMVRPFVEDRDVWFAEPARFVWRAGDNAINRWHALLGAADPLTIHTGNYARQSVLTGTWTGYPHRSTQRDGWERVELQPGAVPVLGANGFMIRREAYEALPVGDYLFDLDHVNELVQTGRATLARPDVGVVHVFCDDLPKFIRKTRRRVDDFFYFSSTGHRSYPWTAPSRMRGIASFVLSTVLVAPVLAEAMRGYRRTGDAGAWAWHVVACWITMAVYAAGVVRGRLRPAMLDRADWRQ